MMSVFIELMPTGLVQGLLLSFVAIGIMIPFKLVNFPDLTAEGSYPLGGAVCVALIALGLHPLIAVVVASMSAGFLGIGTALIHLRFKLNTLLAGIILSTMVYSVNLRIMGKPSLSLFEYHHLFSSISESNLLKFIVLLVVNAIVLIPLFAFLLTEKGLCFRAVGLNPLFAERQGIQLTTYTVLGLFLGNALCGLSASLLVQVQGYVDIGMGVGIVIHALAALMIGENLIGTHTLARQLIAPLIGALIYQQIQGLALSLGLAPSDLKLLTGTIVLIVIAIRGRRRVAH